MSFILDALKKSEQERVRQQMPTTLELPRGKQQRGMPLWMLGVSLLLLINCGLLLMMWLRRDPVAPPAPTTNSAEITTPAADMSTSTTAKPVNRQIRSLEEEASVDTPATEDAEPTRSSATVVAPPVGDTPLVRAVPATQNTVPQTGTASVAQDAAPQRVSAGMPTLESLGGHAALNLPDIRLDLHVYAANAKDRFVFINGKRYHEGDTTAEGVIVDSITTDGVVLLNHGQRFLLPR